jgi:hypothetical protein
MKIGGIWINTVEATGTKYLSISIDTTLVPQEKKLKLKTFFVPADKKKNPLQPDYDIVWDSPDGKQGYYAKPKGNIIESGTVQDNPFSDDNIPF